jgi:hypothetical protein
MAEYIGVCVTDLNVWTVSEAVPPAPIKDFDSTTSGPAIATWTCVELDYSFTTGQIQLFVDDVLAVDATSVYTFAPYTLALSQLGGASRAGTEIFIDDVAFARQHIGC